MIIITKIHRKRLQIDGTSRRRLLIIYIICTSSLIVILCVSEFLKVVHDYTERGEREREREREPDSQTSRQRVRR